MRLSSSYILFFFSPSESEAEILLSRMLERMSLPDFRSEFSSPRNSPGNFIEGSVHPEAPRSFISFFFFLGYAFPHK